MNIFNSQFGWQDTTVIGVQLFQQCHMLDFKNFESAPCSANPAGDYLAVLFKPSCDTKIKAASSSSIPFSGYTCATELAHNLCKVACGNVWSCEQLVGAEPQYFQTQTTALKAQLHSKRHTVVGMCRNNGNSQHNCLTV